MRPTSLPREMTTRTSIEHKYSTAILTNIDCPRETVPIRRIGKENLRKANSFSQSYVSDIHPRTEEFPGLHIAFLASLNQQTYYGVRASLSLNNPKVGAKQSSTSQMWIQSERSDTLNEIRLQFISWLMQDSSTSNWWLVVDDKVHIGYFPASLFKELNGGSSNVAWGALAKSVPGSPSPAMGTGERINLAILDWSFVGYFYNLTVMDSSNSFVNPRPHSLIPYVDTAANPACYDLIYDDYLGPFRGHGIKFGGPGGDCGS
ncbi:hypothetical protein IFM89_014335 [Coptis chinensis]|uniref:Neprosin PEP catalytic domain-containing protein n=1 Tax=Coptis chinensis TaxID=261450 RepID=A0A835HVM8_9MAGN|nr:hypothetical protein IFM89_014335 [Coptis chinensis]